MPKRKPLNPMALTERQLVRLLKKTGAADATLKLVRQHIEYGAPVSATGMINLVHYTAWLVRELANR